MAFMNTPVTHGSATMVVTATGARTELGRISGMLSRTAKEQSPLTKELNTLTLWIAAAAGLTMIVMFALGRYRGLAWERAICQRCLLGDICHSRGAAHRHASNPVVGERRAGQTQRDNKGPSLGRDVGVHVGYQFRQNRDSDNEPDDRGRSH